MLEIEKQRQLFNISFNISCQIDHEDVKHLTIRNAQTESNSHEIELILENETEGISKYIVYYMNNQSVLSKVVSTNDNSFILRNLPEKTLYQICVAAIDDTWRSGYYKCVQERTSFTTSGPVTNITITSFHDRIKVSWNQPAYQYDIPQGYIVNYYDSEMCKSIIINMGTNRIPSDTQCSVAHVKYWQHLQVLTLDFLKPNSAHNIDIRPYIEDKESLETTVSTQTKKIDQSRFDFSPLGTFNYFVTQMVTQNIMHFHYNIEVMEIEILDQNKFLINDKFVICNENEKFHLNLILMLENDELSIPYNISCQSTRKKNKILGMTAKSNESSIVVSWEISKAGLVSLVYYDGRRSHQIVRQSERVDSFELKHVHEKSNYHICMATVNNTDKMSTSPFKCTNIITDFLKSGPVQNLETLASDHTILLKWQDPEYELDRPQGYVLKYINKMNECQTILINEVSDEFARNQPCDNVKRINTKIHQNYIPISSLAANMQYKIEIIPYNHGRIPLKTISTIRTTNENCFYDCRADNYAGVRTTSSRGKPCVKWNESKLGKENNTLTPQLCSTTDSNTPWCFTEDSWDKCDVPLCSELNKISGCVRYVDNNINVSSINVTWIPPQYSGQIKGYITLLHEDNTCVQAQIQICDNCPTNFTKNILNFYQSCQQQIVNLSISYESVFDNVKEDQAYSVFIIPILDESTSGAILNISVQTKSNTKDADTDENQKMSQPFENQEKPKYLENVKLHYKINKRHPVLLKPFLLLLGKLLKGGKTIHSAYQVKNYLSVPKMIFNNKPLISKLGNLNIPIRINKESIHKIPSILVKRPEMNRGLTHNKFNKEIFQQPNKMNLVFNPKELTKISSKIILLKNYNLRQTMNKKVKNKTKKSYCRRDDEFMKVDHNLINSNFIEFKNIPTVHSGRNIFREISNLDENNNRKEYPKNLITVEKNPTRIIMCNFNSSYVHRRYYNNPRSNANQK